MKIVENIISENTKDKVSMLHISHLLCNESLHFSIYEVFQVSYLESLYYMISNKLSCDG